MFSPDPTTEPRNLSTSSPWDSTAWESGMMRGAGGSDSGSSTGLNAPSTCVIRTASAGRSKTRSAASACARSPMPAVSNEARSNFSSGVNSQPGAPLKVGSSSSCQLANGALHLELDEAVHLDRVLHRQLLDD